jgi:imidazolonepropionase-like amidohydrolase
MRRDRRTRTRAVAVAVLLVSLLTHAAGCRVPADRTGELVLVGARVYPSPGDPALEDAVVHLRDATIVHVGARSQFRVPPGASVIDCTGQVVTAGFWNSHVHFIEPRWHGAATASAGELSTEMRRTFLRHGFTTVFDVGSPWPVAQALRARVASGEVTGPRILTAGPVVFPRGGRPAGAFDDSLHTAIADMPEVETPEEARAVARTLLDGGADGIKVYAATWWNEPPARMSAAALRALVEEARARQKPVLAHPSDQVGIETAVPVGVHVLTHTTPAARPWPADLVSRLRQHDVALTPTLTLWRVELERTGVVPATIAEVQQRAVDQLRMFVEAGGTVLFGTDVGYIPEDDPAEEYRLMAAAGMDGRQVLASLTTAPASRFGRATEGRVARGFRADLVVLDGDPVDDIAAFARVVRVIRAGRIVDETP